MSDTEINRHALMPAIWKKLQGEGIGAILARGAAGSFVVGIAGIALAFGTNVLLARMMGATQYGIYIYVLTWINLLSMICHLGLNTSLIRFIPAYNSNQEWGLFRGILGRSVQYVSIASLIIGVITAMIVWYLQDYMSAEHATTFWIALLLLPLLGITGLRQAALRGLKHVVKSGLPDSVIRPVVIIALAAGAYLVTNQGIHASQVMAFSLLGAIVAFLVGTVWLFKALPKQVSQAKPVYRDREWLIVSLPLFYMSVISLIMNKTDIIMVGIILGSDQVGIYAIASRIAGLIIIGLLAANAIVAPLISELYSTDQHRKLQKMITLAARGIGIFTLLISVSIAILGEYILGLFGEEFVSGYVPLLILVTGQVINALAGSVGFLMTMTGHQNQAAKIVGTCALLNVISNAALIPILGLIGAAIATAMTTVIWNMMMLYYVIRKLNINPTVLAKL